MFYSREIYRIPPEKISEFYKLFDQYVLPAKVKNGAKLIGCWRTEEHAEIMIIWEYSNRDEYTKIEERIKKDPLFLRSQEYLSELESLCLNSQQEFLISEAKYQTPVQTVSVSGYITNERDEALLVQTYWRSDTWELPGGGVDESETLDQALCREIFEETGIKAELLGVTGVYSNGSTISIVFRGKSVGGAPTTSNETKDVRFVKLNLSNVSHYIKRGKFIPRVVDAIKGPCVPYESFKVRPYQLIKRLEGSGN